MKRGRFYTGPTCMHPVKDAKGRAKLCGIPAGQARPVEGGGALWFCVDHAAEHDARDTPTTPPGAPANDAPKGGAPTLPRCMAALVESGRSRTCGEPGTERTWPSGTFAFCAKHMPPTPEQADADVRARWDAEQLKLPKNKSRTWEQAGADDEAHLGRALRRAGKRGGP